MTMTTFYGMCCLEIESRLLIVQLTSKHLIGERDNTHEARAKSEGMPGHMPLATRFFKKVWSHSGTLDLGLAMNEGNLC